MWYGFSMMHVLMGSLDRYTTPWIWTSPMLPAFTLVWGLLVTEQRLAAWLASQLVLFCCRMISDFVPWELVLLPSLLLVALSCLRSCGQLRFGPWDLRWLFGGDDGWPAVLLFALSAILALHRLMACPSYDGELVLLCRDPVGPLARPIVDDWRNFFVLAQLLSFVAVAAWYVLAGWFDG